MTFFELMEPLMWMAACWACGIFTGMGIGSVIGGDRADRAELARVRASRALERSQ